MLSVNVGEQSPNYIIGYNAGANIFYALNCKSGIIEFYGASKDTVTQSAIDALEADAGGVILVKGCALPSVTYGSSVLLVVQVGGNITYYRGNVKIGEVADFVKVAVEDVDDWVTPSVANTVNVVIQRNRLTGESAFCWFDGVVWNRVVNQLGVGF